MMSRRETQPLSSNPLELFDAQEQLVAKTIRWVEGTHQRVAPYDAELFGRGQAVILTDAGKAQVDGLRPQFSLGVKVTPL
jgi:hypothetical protein